MDKFESLNDLEKEQYVIKCPVCGQEYLPAEIFLAEDLLGEPTDIIRFGDGKINFYLGEKPTLESEYCCDSCNTNFKVKAKINFESFVEDDFDVEYVSKLKTNILVNEVNLFSEDTAKEE